MLLENRKFTRKSLVIKVSDITGICILRNQLECHLLAASANQQGNMWFLYTLGLVDSAIYMIIFTLEHSLFLCPHCQDDLYCLA